MSGQRREDESPTGQSSTHHSHSAASKPSDQYACRRSWKGQQELQSPKLRYRKCSCSQPTQLKQLYNLVNHTKGIYIFFCMWHLMPRQRSQRSCAQPRQLGQQSLFDHIKAIYMYARRNVFQVQKHPAHSTKMQKIVKIKNIPYFCR